MQYSSLSWNLIGTSIALVFACVPTAIAHNIQVAGDVAGLWHVEPNHNPQAGRETQAWVALTRRGGEILPFSTVNCQMGVYSQPRQANDQPIFEPNVVAINAEKYRDIPGAKMTFPQPGLYQIQLDCQPQKTGSFSQFKLTHDVTVLAAEATQAQPTPSKIPPQPSITPSNLIVIPAVIFVVGGLITLIRLQRRS